MHVLTCGLFLGLALTAGVYDLRFRRIPNWLNLTGATAGVAVMGLVGSGWAQSVLGLVAALIVGFLLFQARTIGAGDAKLMAAFGAWFGLTRLPVAFVAMLAGGALVAVVWAIRNRVLRKTFLSTGAMLASTLHTGTRLRPIVGDTALGKFPYGIGLSAGAAAWWLWIGCGV